MDNKPTSSGRLINYHSNHPLQQKINIVYNLVDRAILLSDKKFHRKNLKIVTTLLKNNNYPRRFVKQHVYKRFFKIKQNHNQKDTIVHKEPVSHISLPFNENFDKIVTILKPYNFRILPLVEKSLSSVIRWGKDPTKKCDKTNVVYKFFCKSCPASYVGETKRTIKIRINEHQKNNNLESVVPQHRKNFLHDFDWDNTLILDHEANYKKRILSEMIHIKCNSNNINKKEDVKFLNTSYFPLLRLLN